MSPKGKSVTAYLEQLVECSITGTTDDILRTCSVIASAKDALSADDFRSLRDRAPITDKVWSKLLQIGLDTRLEELKESLPPKWSTIYLVHNLTDEELKDAMEDGAIHPQVSQGTFNRYLKEKRFQGSAEGTPRDFKSLVQVLIPDNAQEEEVDRFKGDLDKLVSVYGFKTHYEGDTSAVALRKRRSLDRSQELMGVLFKDLKTTWENAPENLKTLFSLSSLEDLVNAPMNDFRLHGVPEQGQKEPRRVLNVPRSRLSPQGRPGVPEDHLTRSTVQLQKKTKRSRRNPSHTRFSRLLHP